MGLREQAAADLKAITEDEDGFGWPIQVTTPEETIVEVIGLANDIATTIDPDTGQAITGRAATVAISLASLEAAGLEIPKNVSDPTKKPWLMEFNDIQGAPHIFKVQEARPDRALGVVVCFLEAYTLAE